MRRLSKEAIILLNRFEETLQEYCYALYSDYYSRKSSREKEAIILLNRLEAQKLKAKKQLIDYIKALENDSNRYC